MKKYQVFCFTDKTGSQFKLYSQDMKTFYGDFYSEREVYNKISALRTVEMEKRMKLIYSI